MLRRIELPRTIIEDTGEPDQVTIVHRKTGTRLVVSRQRLDTWTIGQLRAMISAPAALGTAK